MLCLIVLLCTDVQSLYSWVLNVLTSSIYLLDIALELTFGMFTSDIGREYMYTHTCIYIYVYIYIYIHIYICIYKQTHIM